MEQIRIYVAAPWEHREAAKAARTELEAAGFFITSRWLDVVIPPDATEAELLLQKQAEALHDVEDVYDADAVILLNISKSEGKAVETGLALAWKRPVIIVGQRTNIFHHLPIPRVDTVAEAITQIKEWEAAYKKMRAEALDKVLSQKAETVVLENEILKNN